MHRLFCDSGEKFRVCLGVHELHLSFGSIEVVEQFSAHELAAVPSFHPSKSSVNGPEEFQGSSVGAITFYSFGLKLPF